MTEHSTNVDEIINRFVSPADDPAGRARAFSTLRAWFQGIETNDFALLESLMHEDIVIAIPFSESGRTDPGQYRVYEGIPACVEFWRIASTFEGEMRAFTDTDLTVNPDGSRLFMEMRGDITMQSGAEYRNRYVMRVDFVDGKVRQVREYYNPIVSARAFGRPIAGKFMLEPQ